MANIVLVGKDFPDSIDLCKSLCTGENKIFTSEHAEKDSIKNTLENVLTSPWNKSSIISAHSFLINAEINLTEINHFIFYFDSHYFLQFFADDKLENITAAVDTMINPYLYIAGELIKRIDQLKHKITVSFVVRNYPSKAEVLSNSSKNISISPASNIVNIAETAFTTLADNFATYVNDRNYLSVILAKCSIQNDLYKNEDEIGKWLQESYDSVNNQKNKQSYKNASSWNKVGSKLSSGFALFR